MRAYLPISHKDLEGFVLNKSLEVDELYAPTIHFVVENPDCDEEELEYLLSVAAGEEALELRLSEKAPGIVIALEVERKILVSTMPNQSLLFPHYNGIKCNVHCLHFKVMTN